MEVTKGRRRSTVEGFFILTWEMSLEEMVSNMKLKTKYNRDLSMVHAGAARGSH